MPTTIQNNKNNVIQRRGVYGRVYPYQSERDIPLAYDDLLHR